MITRADAMTHEDRKAVELAIGRILRLGSRPTQPGDVEEYDRCREIIKRLQCSARPQE